MEKNSFRNNLIHQVQTHPILSNEWLESKKQKKNLEKNDFVYWLTQEYHVSVSFVNWFLIAATLTDNQSSKMVLVENVWEELGSGDITSTHVSILKKFLEDLQVTESQRILLPQTKKYLELMQQIVQKSFFHAIGALGPANEYLLKLEYSEMHHLYKLFRKSSTNSFPEPVFFTVNLDADEGHSKRMFDLIETVCTNELEKRQVIDGSQMALDARTLFYDGLKNLESLAFA